MERKKLLRLQVGALAAVVIAGVGFVTCVERIKPGYVGVVYSPSSGVQEEVLSQGWKFVLPTSKVTQYSIATEQMYLSADEREGSKEDEAFDVMTKDGKMNVDFEMSYSFDAEKVPALYTKYRGMTGEDIIGTVVRGKIKTHANEVTSQFTTLEAHMEKKADVNKMLTEHLRQELKVFGVNVESANFTRTAVAKEVEAAITERAKASQELAAEKQKMEKAKLEAERKKVEAKGKADAKIAEAEGIAEANRKIQASLTEELIKNKAVEKWNGSLVEVQGAEAIIKEKEKK